MNRQPPGFQKANKIKDWGAGIRENKIENLFPGGSQYLLKHAEGFLWRSGAWISRFPPLMFWFHQPGKKQYILICYCHHRLAPICQFRNLGERCYTQEGHRFKSKWHSTCYLSRELVSFRFDPSPCSHFSFSSFVSQCLLQKKKKPPSTWTSMWEMYWSPKIQNCSWFSQWIFK